MIAGTIAIVVALLSFAVPLAIPLFAQRWRTFAIILALGAAFFGESMFSLRRDASKVALAWLVARLKVGGYRLLDCQFMTDHLRSLGAVEIDQEDYRAVLASALGVVGSGGPASVAAGIVSLRRAAGAEFGALDRLLSADPARTVDGPASGCVIAQLLGQTS